MGIKTVSLTHNSPFCIFNPPGSEFLSKSNGECEERCPYHLPIREIMEEYYDLYEKRKKDY